MDYPNYQTCAIKPKIHIPEWDILSNLPNALVILNAKGLVVWLNPSAEAMLGYGIIHSLWIDVIKKAFVAGADDAHEISLIDGRRVHVSSASLDSLPGTLITLTDITASRDLERALAHEKKLASIGTMTAQLAHQIRTPLSSATLYAELLNKQPNLENRVQNWIKRLQECHASVEQQIQDLLLFARGTPIEPQVIDMRVWCDEVLQRAEPYLESYSGRLKLSNQLKIRESLIHSESLIGAVLNLIINALQSEATQIDLTLASIDDLGIQISLEDNGKGMSEEVKAHAFSPFYTTKAQGTGLGLPVVFSVVKAHGGRVVLESKEGIGTLVDIYLPGVSQDR